MKIKVTKAQRLIMLQMHEGWTCREVRGSVCADSNFRDAKAPARIVPGVTFDALFRKKLIDTQVFDDKPYSQEYTLNESGKKMVAAWIAKSALPKKENADGKAKRVRRSKPVKAVSDLQEA